MATTMMIRAPDSSVTTSKKFALKALQKPPFDSRDTSMVSSTGSTKQVGTPSLTLPLLSFEDGSWDVDNTCEGETYGKFWDGIRRSW